MNWSLSDFSSGLFASMGISLSRSGFDCGVSTGRECVIMIDGMGRNAITEYAPLIPTLKSLEDRATLLAPFPSTTATSLTTFATGVDAGIHGMVGYTMRVPHSGRPERVLNALKWDERVDPSVWQSQETLFEVAAKRSISVSHIANKRYLDSGFTRAALRGATYRSANTIVEMVEQAKLALASPSSFAYLYLNDVDEASHLQGFGSEKFQVALGKVDNLVQNLLTVLPNGTRIWILSDHGMINQQECTVIGKGNQLLEDVELLAGDTRVRYLYLDQSKVEVTRERWMNELGKKVQVLTREEAITKGLFGDLVLDSNRERIGDLIVICNGGLILAEIDRELQQRAMVGHHGGLTDAEREIPLLTTVT